MITLILIFILTFVLVHWLGIKPKNYPPGPLCLPLIGSALSVETYNFHLVMEKIKKHYGPVIGFKFGPNYTVGVTGAKEVKEVLLREDFQGRPSLPFIRPGIMFNDGQSWAVQRRFAIRHLTDFGFGKKSVENVALEEAEDFFKNVLDNHDIVQVSGLFTVSAINVLWAMMSGRRYTHDDDEFKYLLNCLNRRFRSGNVTGGLSAMFPLLRKLFPFLKYFKEEIEMEITLDDFLQKAVNEHKETKTYEPRDFLDVYIREIEKPDIHPSFSEATLKNVCTDLFSAGSESVGNTLGFCVLYCVLYPEWQEILHQEVKMNADFVPYLDNRSKFPLVEAFLTEVMRCNTIASIAVPHKAVRDTDLNGYFIPKNAMILINIWSVLQDAEHWKDPENFRPQRFLDKNGNFIKDSQWIPFFGLGKRKCPGEQLSKNLIFIYFITLIRRYKFSIPEGHPKPSRLCLSGFTNAPQPFQVKVIKRVPISDLPPIPKVTNRKRSAQKATELTSETCINTAR